MTPTNSIAITAEMLEPVVDAITGNIAVILPIGITIFGIMIGLQLIPSLLRRFTMA